MKQIIEGFEIYNLTTEFQIYDERGLRRKVWKSGVKSIDKQRLLEALIELI